MTQELAPQNNDLLKQMAAEAGEKTTGYSMMPTLTVFNQNPEKPSTEFKDGDLILSKKTNDGYSNTKYLNPFPGVILRTRMMLKTKPGLLKKGVKMYVSNEFDNYTDNAGIIVKVKGEDGKYKEDFFGGYKMVKANYSIEDKFGGSESILDLHHIIYVLVSLPNEEIIRLDFKGTSRSAYFDYMKTFDKALGEHMIGYWTTFSSQMVQTDFTGKAMRFPVAAFSFKKEKLLTGEELLAVRDIQIKFNKEMEEREAMFASAPKVAPADNIEQKELGSGVEQKEPEGLPTINLDDEVEVESLGLEEEKKEEIRLEDVPF